MTGEDSTRFVFEPVQREGTGSLQLSMTPAAMRAVGITSFGGAEFDFKCAPCVREALAKYAEGGYYGFALPDDAYRERIMWWFKNARDWEARPEWVVPTLGTIFSVATCLRMLLGPNGAMIVQPPVYFRYKQAADRLGLRTVENSLVLEGDRYTMDLEGLERLMADPQNKLLVVCNPANPVGRVWTKAELMAVSELSARYGTVVLSDEIFAEVTFDGHVTVPYASLEPGRANAITLTSIGKSFGCTGLNFANAVIPDEALRERFTTQRTRDHFGSVDPFGRVALMAAYTPEGLAWQRGSLDYFRENREILRAGIAEAAPGSVLFPHEGTFVAWVRWAGIDMMGDGLGSFFEERALFEVEPGNEYGDGCEAFARVNLAASHEQTRAACGRLKKAFAAL